MMVTQFKDGRVWRRFRVKDDYKKAVYSMLSGKSFAGVVTVVSDEVRS